MCRIPAGIVIAVMLITGCSRPPVREYELQGQILSIDPATRQVVIKHGDIPGFMPGMTMPFTVRDERLLDGRVPGDLVRATLVVGEEEAHLRTLERTGFAPLPAGEMPVAPAPLLNPGDLVAGSPLVDERGTRHTLEEWRGSVLAVTFIYTRCPVPDFCPLMDRHFKAVQEEIKRDKALQRGARLLSVSFDPEYDTPAVLAKHARALGADPAVWTFLTGDREDVRRFGAQFGMSILPGGKESAGAEIVHNLRTAVIDGEGRLVTIFKGNEWTPAELTAALRGARAGR